MSNSNFKTPTLIDNGMVPVATPQEDGKPKAPVTLDNGMLDFGAQLVVVDNGFVYVGNVLKDGPYYVIQNCFNVREAGTSKGFGQLAFEGPLKGTSLDPCPTVLVPEGRVCHFIACEPVWAKTLK